MEITSSSAAYLVLVLSSHDQDEIEDHFVNTDIQVVSPIVLPLCYASNGIFTDESLREKCVPPALLDQAIDLEFQGLIDIFDTDITQLYGFSFGRSGGYGDGGGGSTTVAVFKETAELLELRRSLGLDTSAVYTPHAIILPETPVSRSQRSDSRAASSYFLGRKMQFTSATFVNFRPYTDKLEEMLDMMPGSIGADHGNIF